MLKMVGPRTDGLERDSNLCFTRLGEIGPYSDLERCSRMFKDVQRCSMKENMVSSI